MIFICGASRSGTTMLARILDRNPKLRLIEELHYFDELANNVEHLTQEEAVSLYGKLFVRYKYGYFSDTPSHPLLNYVPQSRNTESLFSEFLGNVASENEVLRLVEHTPANIRYVERIRKLDVDPKIILLLRDPRDVLLSQKHKWKRKKLGGNRIPLKETIRSYLNYNPIILSFLWIQQYAKIVEKSFFTVKYEELVLDPSGLVQKVCEFVGVPFSRDMLDVPIVGSSTSQDTHSMGVNSDNINKWRAGLNIFEIAICEALCNSTAMKYGYRPIKPTRIVSILGFLYYSLLFFLKAPLQVMFNLHRLKSTLHILYSN